MLVSHHELPTFYDALCMLLQLLARQRRIQGAKQGEDAGQRMERMERQKAATEAGMARQDSKQARADATAAVEAAAAAKKAARDAELAGDEEDEALFLAEAAAADQKRRSGNAAGMLNQYRSMLLEEMMLESWPTLYPHLGEATIEACVSFFDKFDAGRTGRYHTLLTAATVTPDRLTTPRLCSNPNPTPHPTPNSTPTPKPNPNL